MNICVYGSINEDIKTKYLEHGKELGKKIAERNHNLVFGGMKTGLLGSIAVETAKNKNTSIIGVMPDFFKKIRKEELFEQMTEKLYTKTVSERKDKFKEVSDAVIVVPGGIGTFDEFFDAAELKRWGYFDKPIVLYNMENYYKNMVEMLEYCIKENIGKNDYDQTYKVFDDLDEMFDYIENYKKNTTKINN